MNYATLSPDRVYRYLLTRDVSSLRSRDETVTFVMLNPSTADEHENDPTIRRCMGFAKTWGFATLQVVNLYAYRATDPTELMKRSFEVDVVGNPDNDAAIGVAVKASDLVVCAWGANARGNANRLGKVLSMIPEPHCLGRTLDGFPRHPLYLRRFEVPVPFAHCPPEAAWRTRFVNGSTTEATA